MALPFIAGIAVGAGLIVAYNNKSKIKNTILEKAQKTKEFASDLKDKVCDSKCDCEEAKDSVIKDCEKAKDSVIKEGEKVKEGVKKAVNKTKEAVSKEVEDLKQKTTRNTRASNKPKEDN